MRTQIALLLISALSACDNGVVQDSADCKAQRRLYKSVVTAMCVSWSEDREWALADLVEAAQDSHFDETPSADQIVDLASEVQREDCVKAGLSDPGPKSPDPESERIREQLRKIPRPSRPEHPIKIDPSRSCELD